MSQRNWENDALYSIGKSRSWDREAWARGGVDDPVICPDCGAVGPLIWVRGTDLCPRAKVRARNAPEGVMPALYAVLRNGGQLARTNQRVGEK